jgi:hypothetical protein
VILQRHVTCQDKEESRLWMFTLFQRNILSVFE